MNTYQYAIILGHRLLDLPEFDPATRPAFPSPAGWTYGGGGDGLSLCRSTPRRRVSNSPLRRDTHPAAPSLTTHSSLVDGVTFENVSPNFGQGRIVNATGTRLDKLTKRLGTHEFKEE